ncbi:hypothetical protein Natpe_0028 [Natrinema pellirubrum DSM 15624]|uniref:Uncharacterized protein n=1 Tax=Natrinema pellirubrum (strain DSM 15624 / CIP 106293 / JCM 10476 / NCIMB 786 / 157) TaxID=797303 RepID=L0JFA7_NATP1|nr:hypothetical protein [Natrinema pellirubrum]AGB29979.1 hypothetical protein Natpe_0028 [Natrinema pellirubrum DSM 15624]
MTHPVRIDTDGEEAVDIHDFNRAKKADKTWKPLGVTGNGVNWHWESAPSGADEYITGTAVVGQGWGGYKGEVWLGRQIEVYDSDGDDPEDLVDIYFDISASGYVFAGGSGSAEAEIEGIIEDVDSGTTRSVSLLNFSAARAGANSTNGLSQYKGKINNFELDVNDTYNVWVKLRVEAHVQGVSMSFADFGNEDGDSGEYVQINKITIDKGH